MSVQQPLLMQRPHLPGNLAEHLQAPLDGPAFPLRLHPGCQIDNLVRLHHALKRTDLEFPGYLNVTNWPFRGLFSRFRRKKPMFGGFPKRWAC